MWFVICASSIDFQLPQRSGVWVSTASFTAVGPAKASSDISQVEGLVKTVPRDNTTSQVFLLVGTEGVTEAMAQRFDFQQGAVDGTSILEDVKYSPNVAGDDGSISTLGTMAYGLAKELDEQILLGNTSQKRKPVHEDSSFLDGLSIDRLKLEFDKEKHHPLFVFGGDRDLDPTSSACERQMIVHMPATNQRPDMLSLVSTSPTHHRARYSMISSFPTP